MEKHFVATAYGVRDGKVLLVHHKKQNMWLPVGGHIEQNELPDEAVKREFLEETGLEIEILGEKDRRGKNEGVEILHTPHHVQLEFIKDPLGDHYHIDLVYFCSVKNGKERLESAHNEIRWFSKEDLEKEQLQQNVMHFAAKSIDFVSENYL